jgi:heme/copper-type cytochrome/quinol oxidase subunit 1
MHFLGLNGMPRRIPDYPDVYYLWNSLSSYGSFLSFMGVLIFIQTIVGSFYYYLTLDVVLVRFQVRNSSYLKGSPGLMEFFWNWNEYRGYRYDFINYLKFKPTEAEKRVLT